jgi:hypothetical protein
LILFSNLACDQFLKDWVGESTKPSLGTTPSSNYLGVLGQPDAYTNTHTPLKMGSPFSLVAIGTKFAAAVPDSNKVLIWNTFPASPQTPADVVLGQPDLYSTSINNGGLSAKSLYAPFFVSSDGTRLIVADYNNSRVLIWNTIPTVNFTPADVVVGQPNFTTNSNMELGIRTPQQAYIIGNKLLISENTNHRVLI